MHISLSSVLLNTRTTMTDEQQIKRILHSLQCTKIGQCIKAIYVPRISAISTCELIVSYYTTHNYIAHNDYEWPDRRDKRSFYHCGSKYGR